MAQKFKRFLSLVFCVLMLTGALNINAFATDVSSDEAVAWVKSNLGRRFGGGWCVDLIEAYYEFLGETPNDIAARNYAGVDLPEGWTRTKGGIPQKGDILIYTNGYNGHVGIYESDYSTYHQNWSGCMYVVNYGGLYSWRQYWGCIHPNFSDDPVIETEEKDEDKPAYHGVDDTPVSVFAMAEADPEQPQIISETDTTPAVAGATDRLSAVVSFFTVLLKGLSIIIDLVQQIAK
ncbi:MAG: CHAP domain-containing protein [Clostridia bacterium]|nr:CHAP domain-containing protein [Clostridia bacterium]